MFVLFDINQALSHNKQVGYIYGMWAFALLEMGRMSDAEKSALKGLELNKDDPWSQHNVSYL